MEAKRDRILLLSRELDAGIPSAGLECSWVVPEFLRGVGINRDEMAALRSVVGLQAYCSIQMVTQASWVPACNIRQG